jgi:hypothetical protein
MEVNMTHITVGKGIPKFDKDDVAQTLEWSLDKISPVTHAPCHPERHDAEKKSQNPNRFGVLEDSDRPKHGLTTGSMSEFVYNVLTSKVGMGALEWFRQMSYRQPLRAVFSVPKIAQGMNLPGFFFENGVIVDEGKSATMLLIVDADKDGNLYIQTGIPKNIVPPDAGKTAGGRDCFLKEGENVLMIDDGSPSLRPEQIGATTIFSGASTNR